MKNRTLSGLVTRTDAELEHSSDQLPFGAIFEQVYESPSRPEMRVHSTPFENERLCKFLNFHAFRLSVLF